MAAPMTTSPKQLASMFALSAAAVFLGGCKPDKPGPKSPDPGAHADEQVQCFGINECSGQSVCVVNKPELGIEHVCAGENDCRGKGWIKVTRSACETQGGEVLGKF
jgi:hypothetical protein